MAELRVVRSELIVGGDAGAKAARAQGLAEAWLESSPQHRAVSIAPGQAPVELAHAIGEHSRADTLIVVDCLTLWLTGLLMPAVEKPMTSATPRHLAFTIASCAGPLVLVGSDTGVDEPLAGRDLRQYLDSLGDVNQAAAAACERVTLMVAGVPILLKGQP